MKRNRGINGTNQIVINILMNSVCLMENCLSI
ncbi:MAG: hypothetical protein K0R23_382 [Lacrimispora sp.]|jgi:hypothetical protein|nr:hypothetical protein [Lacrimispora sp.]